MGRSLTQPERKWENRAKERQRGPCETGAGAVKEVSRNNLHPLSKFIQSQPTLVTTLSLRAAFSSFLSGSEARHSPQALFSLRIAHPRVFCSNLELECPPLVLAPAKEGTVLAGYQCPGRYHLSSPEVNDSLAPGIVPFPTDPFCLSHSSCLNRVHVQTAKAASGLRWSWASWLLF